MKKKNQCTRGFLNYKRFLNTRRQQVWTRISVKILKCVVDSIILRLSEEKKTLFPRLTF